MSRVFTIEELNKIIDANIAEYKAASNVRDVVLALAIIAALEDLKLELNDPNPLVNVTENVQQSLNAITAQNIINDKL